MVAYVAPALRLVSGRSSRCTALLIDTLRRHPPSPRLGRAIRRAAYRCSAVMGAIIPIGHGVHPGPTALGIGPAVIIPRSLWSIVCNRRASWPDIELPDASPLAEEPLT